MKIAQSNVVMESSNKYSRSGTKNGFISGTDNDFSKLALNALLGKKDEYVTDNEDEDFTNNYKNPKKHGGLKDHYLSGRSGLENILKADENSCDISEEFSLQYDLFVVLFRRLMYGGAFGAMGGSYAFSPSYNSMFSQRVVTYEEHESTEFHAKGQALTEDGRSIDFSVDISMSRSYMEYMDVSIPIATNALLDPLVVNVGSGITELSDQKFKFDLDMDGKEDEISMLSKDAGFLALDKNEDGMINDGSELFGAKTGDGFSELSRFDLDKNGWIDENDDIFDKLRVWFKDEDGRDILMNLKQADIGAIYLGAASTQFTLEGAKGGMNGVIRSTGFFLKESTGVGTIQHIDLAVAGKDTPEQENGEIQQSVPSGTIIMINDPSKKLDIDVENESVSSTEDASKIRENARQRRELEKKEREDRIEKRRLRQKEYEEKRLEELYERKERLQKELDEDAINRLFAERMYEVV